MLIECVPNVSEGRDATTIAALTRAVSDVPGVRLASVSSDAAHHRSVFTLFGTAEALEAAMSSLVDQAIARIDLRRHRGVHPRMGAVDVMPFVPVGGASMDDCVALARRVGASLATRCSLPIYLYEMAAFRPDRHDLSAIRKGGFEGLGARMADAAWTPDFGPQQPHPTAGATAVGARDILIAYNVNLQSDRLDVAKAIAASVRQSGGGLAHVKAMGVPIGGHQVQVSMNLTNYRLTPLRVAFHAVEREAARHGVQVAASELVGLAPAAALTQEIAREIRLPDFRPEQLIEYWLDGL